MVKYSIKAHLRIDKKNFETGECPVTLVVIMNSKVFKMGQASIKVHPDFWNKKEGLIDVSKLNKASKNYRNQKADYEELNKLILHRISEFNRFMLEQERLGVVVTPDKMKSFFEVGKRISFYDFWDKQVELMKPSLRESTLYSYENTKKILKEFRPNLDFGDFSPELITQFDNYLTVVRKNSNGGKFSRHKNLKTILRLAVIAKLIEANPYQAFKIKEAKGNRMRLTFSELITVKDLILSDKHKLLEDNRKMFLFSCFTGLRFSDVQQLMWKDISFGEAKLEMKMLKTSDSIRLPLVPDALQILREQRNHQIGETFVFKRITGQAVNRSLKEIMKEAKIDKHITYHCARHTFATVNLQIGTDIYQVKDLLGHKNIGVTQIYAKTLQMSVDKSMRHFGQMLTMKSNEVQSEYQKSNQESQDEYQNPTQASQIG